MVDSGYRCCVRMEREGGEIHAHTYTYTREREGERDTEMGQY